MSASATEHSDFESAFAGATFADEERVLATRTVRVGALRIGADPSYGELRVFDAFSERDDPPPVHLIRAGLPEGSFPVELCVSSDTTESTRREGIAAARILFSERPAARWSWLPDLYDDRVRPAYDYAGHTVDSGITTLASWPGKRGLAPEPEAIGAGVTVYRWPEAAQAIAFTAGQGDRGSSYPAWVAHDAEGQVVQVAIDYQLLTRPLWKIVELPLPFTAQTVSQPPLAELGVSPEVLAPRVLALHGDVARLWSATLTDEKGRPYAEPDLGRVSPQVRTPRGGEPFVQVFDATANPESARCFRLRVYCGQDALTVAPKT
jgi:hypothetical protein